MIRPRPRLSLATFLLATLGLAAGADAADLAGILLAQSPTVRASMPVRSQ